MYGSDKMNKQKKHQRGLEEILQGRNLVNMKALARYRQVKRIQHAEEQAEEREMDRHRRNASERKKT